jgi:hypothetical protein
LKLKILKYGVRKMGDPGDLVQDIIDVGMSPINTLVIDPLTGLYRDISGQTAADRAADATREAASTAAGAQMEAIDYLREREEIPQALREQALMQLGNIYGIGGATPSPFAGQPTSDQGGFLGSIVPQQQPSQPGMGGQQALIDQAMQSPLYQSLMGGQQAGEESIMRQAAATGGLRSGNVQEAMYDYNTQLQNQALLQAYNEQLSGLQGLAGLPSNASQIAQGMSGIGQTLAQGQVASAQAQQAGQQQGINNLFGLANLGLTGYGLGIFSDRRLKTNVKKIDEVNGHNWYTWDWNQIGNNLGLDGTCMGCMADEVYEKNKDAVTMKDGFLMVCYDKLGIIRNDNRGTA